MVDLSLAYNIALSGNTEDAIKLYSKSSVSNLLKDKRYVSSYIESVIECSRRAITEYDKEYITYSYRFYLTQAVAVAKSFLETNNSDCEILYLLCICYNLLSNNQGCIRVANKIQAIIGQESCFLEQLIADSLLKMS